jgi:hypothetical protein
MNFFQAISKSIFEKGSIIKKQIFSAGTFAGSVVFSGLVFLVISI